MSELPEQSSPRPIRWPTFFQMSVEPLFLLNRRRKLRYVNRAWETLTGYTAAEAIGWGCSGRRSDGTSPVAVVMKPPREVFDGNTVRIRHSVPPSRSGPPWWDLTFVPIFGEQGLLGILGKITPVGTATPPAARGKGLAETLMAIRFEHAQHYLLETIASENPLMTRLAAQVRLASSQRMPVWLQGEIGVGKQTIARLIHHHGSMREKTFATIDCVALPPSLVAAMMFAPGGMMRSSHVGTIYLREPSAMSRDVQERIVDTLADIETESPRLIAGSSRSPIDAIHEGTLLPECFAALNVLEIPVPPLRERIDDVPRLASRLVERLQLAGLPGISGIAPEVFELFRVHRWPGNLRELENVLQSACESANGGRIELHHLPRPFRDVTFQDRQNPPATTSTQAPFLALELILEQVERRLITRALERAKGNRTEAAELLGVTRTELWRRIKALKIEDA